MGRGTRGNTLAIVVAILFILVTLVLGLHASQSRAARNVTQAEAELQFRQGFEFETARLFGHSEPLPDWVKVSGDTETKMEGDLVSDYAKSLFTGLPDLSPLDKEFAPGFDTHLISPSTHDSSLKVFAGRAKWLVTQKSGGYAAYAPKGKITITSAMAWANPGLDDDQKAVDAASGVPILMAAQSDLSIEDLKYGYVYSEEGDIDVKGDGAIAFRGQAPLRAYEDDLISKLETLKSALSAACSNGNKTSQIDGDYLETAGSMVDMLFGGDKEPGINLEQATRVPFPMIPGFSATVPGVFYEIWFHMPYAPDFADFEDQSERDHDADAKEAKRLKDEIDKLKKEVKELDKKIAAASGSEKEDLIEEREKKQDELNDLEREAEDLQDEMEKDSKRNNDAVGGKVGSEPAEEPETRREDKEIPVPKDGMTGWAYASVFEGFGGLLLKVITGQFEEISESVVNFVRVYHFGKKDYEPEFRFDDGFFAKASLTVPPGRTFRYDGKLEIEGDLWLQKGSVMFINGDLTLNDPNSSNNPFKSSGKLVLEEGSSLVVEGDVELAGSSKYGSLWVCSAAGKIRPINTSILCSGTLTIPHGSFTATNLEDGLRWLGTKEQAFNDAADVVKTLLQDVAPNLSKVAGPFHMRRPFFAKYAATFQLTMVPTPVGTIPVPTAIPLPRKNIMVPIFRGFTYLYTPMMNAALGENLYAHADWWGFGEGTIPVIVKLDPIAMAKAVRVPSFGNIDLQIDWEETLKRLDDEVLSTAMNVVIEQVAKKVVSQIAKAAIPGGGLIGIAFDEALDLITGETDHLEKLREELVDATIGPVVSKLEDWVDDARNLIEDGLAEGYLREVNGPLIFADSINVGEDSSPKLMAGMLVAKTSVNIQSRNFVGSIVCAEGDIETQNFYYSPHFTRASLYKPKDTKSNWLERTFQFEYGSNFDSQGAIGVDTEVNMVRTEAWNR